MSNLARLAASFNSDGYVTGIDVSDPDEVREYRQRFNELEQVEGREKCAVGLVDWHFQRQFIWELATHRRILEVVEAILGPDVLLLATHIFCKYGPQMKFVAWHQDVTYWGLEPPEAITVWYAIDDSNIDNGCMRVIPGTHGYGVLQHGKSHKKDNLLSIDQEVAVSKEDEARAVDLVLRAGQISVHDGRLIHGSGPNPTTSRRCGLTLRYARPSVRQVEKNSQDLAWRAILVCGTDHDGHFQLADPPFAIKR